MRSAPVQNAILSFSATRLDAEVSVYFFVPVISIEWNVLAALQRQRRTMMSSSIPIMNRHLTALQQICPLEKRKSFH